MLPLVWQRIHLSKQDLPCGGAIEIEISGCCVTLMIQTGRMEHTRFACPTGQVLCMWWELGSGKGHLTKLLQEHAWEFYRGVLQWGRTLKSDNERQIGKYYPCQKERK